MDVYKRLIFNLFSNAIFSLSLYQQTNIKFVCFKDVKLELLYFHSCTVKFVKSSACLQPVRVHTGVFLLYVQQGANQTSKDLSNEEMASKMSSQQIGILYKTVGIKLRK